MWKLMTLNDVYTSYKKSLGNNNALATLKSDLQRVNKTIANIMSAIEKGVVTNTIKSRLEELETEQISLHEKIIIEEAKVQYELSKEDIYNFFKFAVNAGTEFCYDLFIRFVKVYNHKIEIGLNYGLNQVDNDREQIIRKVSIETHEITRLFKGGTVKTKYYNYDIYVVI